LPGCFPIDPLTRVRLGAGSIVDPRHTNEVGVNLHEYQARDLLKAAGVPMFDGDVASTPTGSAH
jgi:hypothetical protein